MSRRSHRRGRAPRLLIDGSFVTEKTDPLDVDAVVLIPNDFESQVEAAFAPAVELDDMIWARRPEELFAAEDEDDWNERVDEELAVYEGRRASKDPDPHA